MWDHWSILPVGSNVAGSLLQNFSWQCQELNRGSPPLLYRWTMTLLQRRNCSPWTILTKSILHCQITVAPSLGEIIPGSFLHWAYNVLRNHDCIWVLELERALCFQWELNHSCLLHCDLLPPGWEKYCIVYGNMKDTVLYKITVFKHLYPRWQKWAWC